MKKLKVTKNERRRREKAEHAIDGEVILGYARHRVGHGLAVGS